MDSHAATIRRVREARARLLEGAARGLMRCAEDLLGRASRDAPLEEGTLRASGTVTLVVNNARFEGAGALEAAIVAARTAALAGLRVTLEAEVAFNTVYAAAQHEGIDFEHPLAGKAKYLEAPLVEQGERYGRIITASARSGRAVR